MIDASPELNARALARQLVIVLCIWNYGERGTFISLEDRLAVATWWLSTTNTILPIALSATDYDRSLYLWNTSCPSTDIWHQFMGMESWCFWVILIPFCSPLLALIVTWLYFFAISGSYRCPVLLQLCSPPPPPHFECTLREFSTAVDAKPLRVIWHSIFSWLCNPYYRHFNNALHIYLW